jgi:hypothetical protein
VAESEDGMTTEAKHTKGPWLMLPTVGGDKSIFIEAGDEPGLSRGEWYRCLRCEVDRDDCCTETAEANARLIAAAPDLLAACEAFAKWFDGWCPNATCCAESGLPIHEQTIAAIAKAKGTR